MNLNNIKSKFNLQLSSKPEKLIINACLAVAGAILFDEHKRKLKKPEKYRNFFQRTKRNYGIVDKLVSKTIAKDISKNVEKYNSDFLNDLKVENAEYIDIN